MLNVADVNPFYVHGLRFSCTRCSVCCRFDSGFVFLSEKDVSMLCVALKLDKLDLLEKYCRWVPGETGENVLSLKEKNNLDCVFWSSEQDGCSVYKTRPLQCRAFPFWPSVIRDENSWELTAGDCPGMNNGTLHSSESIKNWLAIRKKEPIISMSI